MLKSFERNVERKKERKKVRHKYERTDLFNDD